MSVGGPFLQECQRILAARVNTDDARQANHPSDPRSFGRVEFAERAILDGSLPEIKFGVHDVVDLPLLTGDRFASFRGEFESLLVLRVEGADLDRGMVDQGHVAFDTQ